MTSQTERPTQGLAELREHVQRLDEEIIRLLAERVRVARRIGAAKRELAQPTLNPSREAEVVRRAGELARAAALPDEPIRELFWAIIALSRDAQREEGR
jgi:chorismate mutase